MRLPTTLPDPTTLIQTEQHTVKAQETESPKLKRIKSLRSFSDTNAKASKKQSSAKFKLPKGKLTLNAEDLPLKNFIHLALGEILQIPFEMDAAVANNNSPVNLHITKALPADQVLEVVEQVLATYDVAITPLEHGLKVLPRASLKDMPATLSVKHDKIGYGQIIEVIPLQYAEMSELNAISGSIFQLGKYGRVSYNKRLNAVIAIGEAKRVKRFREFVDFLDRAGFNKHQLRLIRPIYWQAEDLAKQLINLLKVQGIPTTDDANDNSSVVIQAVGSMNTLLVTSPQKKWMRQAEALIKQLDDSDAAGPKVQTFIYFTQHRPADELGELINSAVGGGLPPSQEEEIDVRRGRGIGINIRKTEASKAGKKTAHQSINISETNDSQVQNLKVIVDDKRSALIFIGRASSYEMVVPILKALDIPVRQVLIEITVADVSLDAAEQLGVEWQITDVDIGATVSSLGTMVASGGGLGLAAGGLSYAFEDKATGIKAQLNALATKGKAKILSTPTILAMDGETAHMQVGTQISVVTSEISNSNSSNNDGTGLLRSFTYIDTGVILDISPTITDHGSILMELRQEVSEVGSGGGDQPPIFTREIDTVIVANSGQSVLLGGLITHNQSDSVSKVPLLGDIPFLGALFRTTKTTDRSTEMIILITPHIIKDQYDAAELTQSYRSRLGW
jgi:general secretion pathway protein D